MSWILLLSLVASSCAYFDAGSVTYYGHIEDLRSITSDAPETTETRSWMPASLTTVVASITEAPAGNHEVFYSIYYTDDPGGGTKPRKRGLGVFKRGVFVNEAPIFPTCKDCDASTRCSYSPPPYVTPVSAIAGSPRLTEFQLITLLTI